MSNQTNKAKRQARKPKPYQIIREVKPSTALRTTLSKQIKRELNEMQDSVLYWLMCQYREQHNALANDAIFTDLNDRFTAIEKRWKKRSSENIKRWSNRFAEKLDKDVTNRLNANFKSAGLSKQVKRSLKTDAIYYAFRERSQAILSDLISWVLDKVKTLITTGLLNGLAPTEVQNQIKKDFATARKYAANNASDLTSSGTTALSRAYNNELGLTKAIWVHIPGKKYSRRTHERFNGKEFDLNVGLYDSDVGRNVIPSELKLCKCTYRLVVPKL